MVTIVTAHWHHKCDQQLGQSSQGIRQVQINRQKPVGRTQTMEQANKHRHTMQ